MWLNRKHCNRQVGAGTMNPATFLRVLGPEPWAVCYVEPSVRPDDSRYGENPNRLQQHTQFQARAPGDPRLRHMTMRARLREIDCMQDSGTCA